MFRHRHRYAGVGDSSITTVTNPAITDGKRIRGDRDAFATVANLSIPIVAHPSLAHG
jgi:hypothetical protein